MLTVLKIGGQQLDDDDFLARLGAVVASYPGELVIVHGGGRATTQLMECLGLQARFSSEGLRITDGPTLEAAIMGLKGTASAALVATLVKHGVAALGLSGLDAGLVRCTPRDREQLGFVGDPAQIDCERIVALVGAGFLPCLAPICIGSDGQLYNVNADPVAGAVAAATGARALVFVTNVAAVLREGQPVRELSVAEAQRWIEEGIIAGGMIPKVKAAFDALRQGVAKVLITDIAGLGEWLQERPAGTVIT